MPLPYLEGEIPTMAANLRDLELILYRNNPKKILFASLPLTVRFESWLHGRICRRRVALGLPDRDTVSWSDEIIKACQNIAAATIHESLRFLLWCGRPYSRVAGRRH